MIGAVSIAMRWMCESFRVSKSVHGCYARSLISKDCLLTRVPDVHCCLYLSILFAFLARSGPVLPLSCSFVLLFFPPSPSQARHAVGVACALPPRNTACFACGADGHAYAACPLAHEVIVVPPTCPLVAAVQVHQLHAVSYYPESFSLSSM